MFHCSILYYLGIDSIHSLQPKRSNGRKKRRAASFPNQVFFPRGVRERVVHSTLPVELVSPSPVVTRGFRPSSALWRLSMYTSLFFLFPMDPFPAPSQCATYILSNRQNLIAYQIFLFIIMLCLLHPSPPIFPGVI